MGKKRVAVLGSESEEVDKAKRAVQREQKKLREGKGAKVAGMGGGQRVVDTAAESLAEYDEIQAKNKEIEQEVPTEEGKASKRKSRVRSKAYQAAKSKVEAGKTYSIQDAVKLLREVAYSPKNTTVELHLNLRDKGGSWEVELPHATGKTRRIVIADKDTLANIEAGKIDFDVLIASPADMPKLVKFAKVLGPRGLMPNPKTGTVVENPAQAAKKMAASSAVVIKGEKDAPLAHTSIGKLAMTDAQLSDNISAILSAISNKASKAVLKSTMSPAIKLAL